MTLYRARHYTNHIGYITIRTQHFPNAYNIPKAENLISYSITVLVRRMLITLNLTLKLSAAHCEKPFKLKARESEKHA